MPNPSDAVPALEELRKLSEKVFFDRLFALGIATAEQNDGNACKKLSKLSKSRRIKTARQPCNQDQDQIAQAAKAILVENKIAFEHLAKKLIADRQEVSEAARSIIEAIESETPVRRTTRKRAARAPR